MQDKADPVFQFSTQGGKISLSCLLGISCVGHAGKISLVHLIIVNP